MAEVNAYEAARAARIEQNRKRMQELGLLDAARDFYDAVGQSAGVTLEAGDEQRPRTKKRKQQAPVEEVQPSRVSRRLRGEAAPGATAAAAAARKEAEDERLAGGEAGPLGATRKGSARRALTLAEGSLYAAPFSLRSIGTTVWDLGHIHRGAWAQRYWSSSGCLFHHAYPVGFRASKVQFGRTYEMTIEVGPTGPVFKVTDQKSGTGFSGPSPTRPWTDVCIAHRTGQRISGPLFYGFSDPVTQRAIASLYSAEELAAALQGEKPEREATALTPEERAAAEFCSLQGVGDSTAIALARTRALGGAPHGSLQSLRTWAQASAANAVALAEWLTSSGELPVATRRWPAWRLRLVPAILEQLGAPLPAQQAAAGGEAAQGGAGGAGDAGGAATAKGEAGGGGRAGATGAARGRTGGAGRTAAAAAEGVAGSASSLAAPARASSGARAAAPPATGVDAAVAQLAAQVLHAAQAAAAAADGRGDRAAWGKENRAQGGSGGKGGAGGRGAGGQRPPPPCGADAAGEKLRASHRTRKPNARYADGV